MDEGHAGPVVLWLLTDLFPLLSGIVGPLVILFYLNRQFPINLPPLPLPYLPPRLVHRDRFGSLWRARQVGTRAVRWHVEVLDPSDHKFKKLKVPSGMKTAHEAVAWTFGRKPEDYAPTSET